MPYSADMLLENVLDSSHVPFTHHQTISKRENAVPLPLVLDAKVSARGFSGRFKRETDNKSGGSESFQGRSTKRTTVFKAPTYMHHRIQTAGKDTKGKGNNGSNEDGSGNDGDGDGDYTLDVDMDAGLSTGFETWTVAYATPTGPGRCRLFARFPFRFPAPPKVLGCIPVPNFPKLVLSNLPDWANHMAQLKVGEKKGRECVRNKNSA
jgi:phenylpropionate dioxygenase-like ring-hydroxylating dioxygenase large terminal subunit